MSLTAEEVSEAVGPMGPMDPTNPHSWPPTYEEAWQWWFIPSADPPGRGLESVTPEPQAESFAMPDRYYEAGFLGFVVKRFSGPSGEVGWVAKPGLVDLGVATYEESEGAQEALALGARIYGLFPLSTLLSDDAQIGREVLATVELRGIGDGAVIDRIPSATAVSVRVDNHVGTVIVNLLWQEGDDVPRAAEALAEALAEKLAAAR